MDEGKTSIKDGILQTLEEIGQGLPDPEPPQSYFMSSIEMSAMSVFENNGKLTRWMHERGLDPHKGPDSVLGLGLLLIMDAKINPRPEPSEDDDFEWPDDHHH